MVAHSAKPLLGPLTPTEFEHFLTNSPPATGIRLLLRSPKSPQVPGLTRAEAIDIALCHGWIDGQGGRHSADYNATSFTPRRPRSIWSEVNQEKVGRLIAAGRMKPGGQAEIDRAKADGRWAAAYRMKGMEPDADFASALRGSKGASEVWDGLGKTKRFLFLMRLKNMKREATKRKRIGEYVAMLERGETLG